MADDKPTKEPSGRASGLADRIMGRASTNDAINTIIAGASISGQDRTSEEGPQPNRVIQSRQEEEDDDEEDSSYEEEAQLDATADEGGDEEELVDDDQEDEVEEDDEEAYETVAYDDDDLVEVMVDGELREATLSELKAAFSGEGAIEKRLKEATELRKTASAERDTAIQQIEEHRTNMLRTIQALDEALFMPLVNKPPASLRTKNMNEYLLQQDAYEEDQKRIVQSRAIMTKFLNDQQQAQANVRHQYREQQQKLLVENMPEIRDPKQAAKIQSDILGAAAHYGFTQEQVAQVDNHGLFLMARDAARWLNLQKLKQGGKPTSGNMLKRKKRLRSGSGVASLKSKAVASAKQKKAVVARAQQTGKVDDVAAVLLSNARSRGQPNGRSSRNR